MSLSAAHSPTAVQTMKDAGDGSQYTSRLYAGFGLGAAGLGLSIYANSRPWKDTRTNIFQSVPKFQRKGSYVATAAITLMLCGAELLVAESSTSKAATNKVLDDMLDGKPYTPFQEDIAFKSAASWYAKPFSREGAPVALWFGLGFLAADRASHVGAIQYSRFRHSPFWTGKMMLPLIGAFGFMYFTNFSAKVDDYNKLQQQANTTMGNLISRAGFNTPRAKDSTQ